MGIRTRLIAHERTMSQFREDKKKLSKSEMLKKYYLSPEKFKVYIFGFREFYLVVQKSTLTGITKLHRTFMTKKEAETFAKKLRRKK